MWGMITALVSGALMSIQGVFNSAVMKQTSMWVSAGWVQISAFVVCLLMWFFTGRGAVSELWQIEPQMCIRDRYYPEPWDRRRGGDRPLFKWHAG